MTLVADPINNSDNKAVVEKTNRGRLLLGLVTTHDE